jgi:hypothetical protein
MNAEIDTRLTQARQLADSDPKAAAALYAEILALFPACLEAHNHLERSGHAEAYQRWMGINCEISEHDDIFRFFANHPQSHHPVRDYLADGWRSLSELMVVLERVDRPLLTVHSMLEFACGHGRLTRHLKPILGDRLSASDVVGDAVDFVGGRLGVTAWVSAMRPSAVEAPQSYEVVFALSLFTHLPVDQWPAWIEKLLSMTAPGGLLCFSVHSAATAAHHGVQFDDQGVCFIPSSESAQLSGAEYGTTFTHRQVLDKAVGQVVGRPPDHYLEQAFWSGQDAVVIKA